MHVVLISECTRKSVSRTQRILDSYAPRAGIRTWITPITREGLAELHAALRKSATRNTAVACYQNDGRRRMCLLWIVGARGRFSADGAVAVRTSRRLARRAAEIPLWLRCVCLLAQAASLVHDLGKYSVYFQNKLRDPKMLRDIVRHEWISVCLLRALRQGTSWQEAWQVLHDGKALDEVIKRPTDPGSRAFHAPATALEAVDFLVASHHLLFSSGKDGGSVPLVAASHVRSKNVPQNYSQPHESLPEDIWKNFQRLESKLSALTEALQGQEHTEFWWACLILARAALIFADHTVSARAYPTPPDDDTSAANTRFVENKRVLNQPLHWHLTEVAHVAANAAWRMGQLSQSTEGPLEGLQEASVASIVEPADEASRYHWQNLAADALARWRQDNPDTPCLVFNMAGTGSGKTRMNLRAACILSRDASPRCSIALNLRTLTLQTGYSLQSDLGILPADMATVIGDGVTQKLFDWAKRAEAIDDQDMVEPEILCSGDSGPLPAWMEPFWRTARERVIVGSPLLVSTIDFLDAAGRPDRQGHHVKALLRLMTADLVLDEVDGYEPDALVAVLRLVQLSAFFGRNIVCSSATLSLATADAVHAAWISGQKLRRALMQDPDMAPARSGIAVIDDSLAPEVLVSDNKSAAFSEWYAKRLQDMMAHLRRMPCMRRAFLQPVEPSIQGFQNAVLEAVQRLHTENAWEFSPGRGISFGLVRVANINGAVATARSLALALPHAHVACYHSGDWRISRFHKERRLDHLLTRKRGNAHILADKEIRSLVARTTLPNVPFIVVATPVEEVGRDHDFDWAVIEPSSAQSIVQVAGRVNRHRLVSCGNAHNIAILRYNLRHCKNCEQGTKNIPVFKSPGYESKRLVRRYKEYDLGQLLPWQAETLTIDAGLRLGGGSDFAIADDRGIAERVTRFFGADSDGGEGLFSRSPIDAFRMSATPYEQTPLRNRAGRKQLWLMRVDGENALYFRWDEDPHGASWVRNKHEMREEEAAPNAWLALSPPEMERLCHEAGIWPEEGLQAELTSYTNDSFMYDLGFGIRRIT
ncbi:type I-F CRISPR-associated helicase Cas3f [Desulfovibrio sp. 86]|uniref:CRISPR-associated helicase cas3 n=1 Tax=uncultured Desulfovibrio sp. TaxID=167968 RepID=A0A212L062_9BACT|nr:type I-F CRISPR-associated helicase Cas3f [Desulfovibrio sp. 86]SCM70928.1 CRISPR-associated helicase cas3 [uncultured Desulfovibrio sp.]VZH32598.1 CRISPR-associated helicase cas3 [Desulfovibrio sp. 86]